MRFIKMHGIGNDYVYINGFAEPGALADPAALAVKIADRHKGVGGDGLILLLPPEPPGPPAPPGPADPSAGAAHVRMRMFNADGSESEMCGNGVRCVCKLAHDHRVTPGITSANPMRVQTGRGVLTLHYTLDAAGKVDRVTVDMGQPIFDPAKVPVRISSVAQVVNHPTRHLFEWPATPGALSGNWIERAGLDQRMTCVSMGNPHAVFYCQSVSEVPLEWVGPVIEHHPAFPKRVNAHFVQVHSAGEVTMRTWERGSGITLACGTGASAVCVAGVLTGRSQRRILAHLPGGDLELEWRQADQHVLMTGPAVEVFEGEWPE